VRVLLSSIHLPAILTKAVNNVGDLAIYTYAGHLKKAMVNIKIVLFPYIYTLLTDTHKIDCEGHCFTNVSPVACLSDTERVIFPCKPLFMPAPEAHTKRQAA
jgi:hypothetical protein